MTDGIVLVSDVRCHGVREQCQMSLCMGGLSDVTVSWRCIICHSVMEVCQIS